MKSKKILITIITLIAILLLGTIKVQAASVQIYASKTTAEVGDDVTITTKFTAAAWNVKVSGNGISGASYASQTSDLSETANEKTFKLDTSKAGTYIISISGDITDSNGDTKEVEQSCTVTINEKTVAQDPEPEPETPTVEETPSFTDVNKTMYAEKDINLRASWSTNSKATSINKGTELTVTGTSSNKVNGYIWYRVTYNGQTLYVASNLLTNTKPEEAQESEQPEQEESKETLANEQTTVDETSKDNEAKDGLKSLEIEEITLSPEFSSDVYEYRAIIKKDLTELTINAVPVADGATITIAGNTNLQEGENLITIVVYNAKNEVEATYQITINKNTLDLANTDEILKAGTQAAKRNLIIFFGALAVAIVALIVVIILRHRNKSYEEGYEEENPEGEEATKNEQIVENIENENAKEEENQQKHIQYEQTQDEIVQEETRKPRWEKRKGKHF